MKDMPGLSKELQELARLAIEQGWTLSLNPQGKVVWKSPDKSQQLIYTTMRLSGKNLARVQGQLSKAGLDISSLHQDRKASSIVADGQTTAEILQDRPGTAIPLPEVILEQMPSGPADVKMIQEVVNGLTTGPDGFDKTMSIFIFEVCAALASYANDMNYKLDGQAEKDLEEALKLMEQAESELLAQKEKIEKQAEELTRLSKECGEAKQKEAAALERAVAAENKFASLKKLLSD